MNRERALLLAEALESGQYVQGKRRLERERPDGVREYCCLGVACRIAQANGVELDETFDETFHTVVYEVDNATQLPDVVRDWFGFKSSSGAFGAPTEFNARHIEGCVSLMGHNDTGTSFAGIARIIRENWELL